MEPQEPKVFGGSFTQQEPVPEEGIDRAVEVMRSGRLHRYNVAGDEISETSLLEKEFAEYLGCDYCLACASGGYAMHLALCSFGLAHGEPVLTNAFTLAPVPGAIHNAGGRPVLVESTRDLVIDLGDLERKIRSSGSRLLLLSHMRGHIVDMDALTDLLDRHRVALIEDCAHTMGASWGDLKSGNFGAAACFSTQTYKHLNSGEGGLMTTRDPTLMARAVVRSGSYLLYDRHIAVPGEAAFADARLDDPNCSGRMDNVRAAILRPQLRTLDANRERWNRRYRVIEAALSGVAGLSLPRRPAKETFVGSSIQFLVDGLGAEEIPGFVAGCRARGVELKWFGGEPSGYTSRHQFWRYVAPQSLPQTDTILEKLCDMRIPLTFSAADCALIAEIVAEELARALARR